MHLNRVQWFHPVMEVCYRLEYLDGNNYNIIQLLNSIVSAVNTLENELDEIILKLGG